MFYFAVSGAQIHVVGVIVCLICVFYTILVSWLVLLCGSCFCKLLQGGIKAVVYTDTWQTLVMFFSVTVVVVLGVVYIGGFDVIFDRAFEGGRITAPE